MSEKELLSKAADTVLENTVSIEVDIYPKTTWDKIGQKTKLLPTKKTFVIRPVTLGTLIKISKLLLEVNVSVKDLEELMLDTSYKAFAAYGETLAKIIAVAIQNTKEDPDKSLTELILNQFTAPELLKVLLIVFKQMDISTFMNCIVSIRGLQVLKETNPVAGEKIAPGL